MKIGHVMALRDSMETIATRKTNRLRAVVLLLAITGACGALPGCVYQRAEEATQAKTALVGMSRAKVETCMGAPFNAETDGSTITLTYNSSRKPEEKLFCKVNIEIQKGLVSRVEYSGWTGGLFSEDEQCAPVVEKCLAPRPPGMAEKLEGLLHF
jgi:hypothetical protein